MPDPINDLIQSLLCSVGYSFSICYFCRQCLTTTRKKYIVFSFLCFIIVFALDMYALTGSFSFSGTDFLWQILLMLCVAAFFHGKLSCKIFAAAASVTIIVLTTNFITSSISCILLVFRHIILHESSPVPASLPEYAILLPALLCCCAAVRFLSPRMAMLFQNHEKNLYLTLTAPLLCLLILWNILNIGARHGFLFRGENTLNPYTNQLLSHTATCVFSAICICAAGFYVFGTMQINLERQKKERFRSQLVFYQMLSEQYAAQERLRHDMKNHIIALRRLTADKAWNQLDDYLLKMSETGGLAQIDNVTGNRVVDALLHHKHRQALTDHIRWECDAFLPTPCFVDDFDLCVILGNLIDNALKACAEIPFHEAASGAGSAPDRSIRITCHVVKKFLLIEIVNTATLPSVRSNTHSQKEVSSGKPNPHVYNTKRFPPDSTSGIGLANVHDTVEKYNGTLEIHAEDGRFRVSILLPAHDSNMTL